MEAKKVLSNDNKKVLSLAGAAGGAALILEAPAYAAAGDGITELTAMATQLGTLSGVIIPVVIVAMTVRLGIKFVNRMTVKG